MVQCNYGARRSLDLFFYKFKTTEYLQISGKTKGRQWLQHCRVLFSKNRGIAWWLGQLCSYRFAACLQTVRYQPTMIVPFPLIFFSFVFVQFALLLCQFSTTESRVTWVLIQETHTGKESSRFQNNEQIINIRDPNIHLHEWRCPMTLASSKSKTVCTWDTSTTQPTDEQKSPNQTRQASIRSRSRA